MRGWRDWAGLIVRGSDAPFIRHDLEELYQRDRARGLSPWHAGRRYVQMLLGSLASLLNASRRNMQNAFLSDLRQARARADA